MIDAVVPAGYTRAGGQEEPSRVPLIEHSQKTIGVLREQSAVRAVTRTGGIL